MNVLACDLGGTRLKIGVISDGRVLARTAIPSETRRGLAAKLPELKAAWLGLLSPLRLGLSDCAGASVAFPSFVDPATGRVSGNFGKYQDAPDLDLRAWGRAELGLPLAIDNDARLALIGEWKAGAGLGADNFVMMTLGTGIGTSAVVEGRVLRGVHGQAGILGGHLTVRHDGLRCVCGNIGCPETEASIARLRTLAAASPDLRKSPLRSVPEFDHAALFKAAAAGDPCALSLRSHSLRVWSATAVNLIHAYDPDLLVVGGGIMASAEVILPALREHIGRHALTPWGRVRVESSVLGDDAALVGGEWLLAEQFERKGSGLGN